MRDARSLNLDPFVSYLKREPVIWKHPNTAFSLITIPPKGGVGQNVAPYRQLCFLRLSIVTK